MKNKLLFFLFSFVAVINTQCLSTKHETVTNAYYPQEYTHQQKALLESMDTSVLYQVVADVDSLCPIITDALYNTPCKTEFLKEPVNAKGLRGQMSDDSAFTSITICTETFKDSTFVAGYCYVPQGDNWISIQCLLLKNTAPNEIIFTKKYFLRTEPALGSTPILVQVRAQDTDVSRPVVSVPVINANNKRKSSSTKEKDRWPDNWEYVPYGNDFP